VATADSPEEQVLYAFVTLYVKEKTGVESTYVEIAGGQKPLKLIDDDKADLVLAATAADHENVVFAIEDYPGLVSGKRPYEDLQFTTVLPALKKLNGLLNKEDIDLVVGRVNAGESAMSVVRKFLMERRWI
ncbi:MAG: hypothetical protein GWO08_16535, partial [Gammaproteobacteria bacterium]|nr:hypothetical protein [Gammaproteobacteria bacterium]NIR95200.1 hypothetical protein [Gammaproteobacteria bacterium]